MYYIIAVYYDVEICLLISRTNYIVGFNSPRVKEIDLATVFEYSKISNSSVNSYYDNQQLDRDSASKYPN